ncbi:MULTISPECIES: glycoside hydrolase family 15 protein [Sphingomonas]|uniref:Glycoside hydrolase family 15 protein n=1 Tax=Sphingomonas kyungheensis TaxID=1069987 RepID=A0ABU8GZF4_9SPHN|nr:MULTISPECIES: glycoside hydrolase family 15 protein [unclassified Sphingomonas]EZP55532.1 Glycoside hydrolase 15-related protein [Sphingomonas sp. RIT328]
MAERDAAAEAEAQVRAQAAVTPRRRIGDHGIIGDMETAALVAADGTIDYLCWPSLDSPSVFAELLDAEQGGAFEIVPALDDARVLQIYVPDTNVLTTRWMASAASVEILDLMPHPDICGDAGLDRRCLIRQITVTRGTVRFTARCRPRFDYAREVPEAAAVDGGVRFAGRALTMRLYGSVPVQAAPGEAVAEFTLGEGETAWFVLGDDALRRPDDAGVSGDITETTKAWQHWLSRTDYRGRWREAVLRSALALKLLTSDRHGSIAAAATFGLPEAVGAGRNWDYRATWIRDASFTVYAFMRLGFIDEAEHFRQWAGKRVMASDQDHPIRIMYAIDGSHAKDETELPHLAGYAGSRPVRIGNGAHAQSQLDIFGELMDSVYLSNKYGAAIDHAGWQHVRGIVDYVIAHWQEPDAGIWEMRSEPRHFLHSRLMCWVALDRAIRLAKKRSLSAPLVAWSEARDAIVEDIWSNFRHPEHGYFVQSRGGTELDAALLMMPLMRFVSSTDPVWLTTLDAIGAQLRDDGLVYRYRGDDGLDGQEGAFTTCTFWYAECLARAGRLDEAQLILAKGIAYANPLGLFSEELDLRGEPIGNFPQALTHLALISAAYFIDRRLDPSYRPNWQP